MLEMTTTLETREILGVFFVYEVTVVKLFGFTVFTTRRYLERL